MQSAPVSHRLRPTTVSMPSATEIATGMKNGGQDAQEQEQPQMEAPQQQGSEEDCDPNDEVQCTIDSFKLKAKAAEEQKAKLQKQQPEEQEQKWSLPPQGFSFCLLLLVLKSEIIRLCCGGLHASAGMRPKGRFSAPVF